MDSAGTQGVRASADAHTQPPQLQLTRLCPRPKQYAGLILVFTVALSTLSLRTRPDEHGVWDRLRASFLSSERVLNDGTVSLEYNEYWQKNWNEETLSAATRNGFDPWTRHPDLPSEQYRNREETVVSLRQLLIDLPQAFP